MAIDDPDHEVPPAGKGTRRVRVITAGVLIALILGFLIWYVASNSVQQNPDRGMFGSAEVRPTFPVGPTPDS